MTDQRKDEIPIYVRETIDFLKLNLKMSNIRKAVMLLTEDDLYNVLEYLLITRVPISPHVPDDVADLIEQFNLIKSNSTIYNRMQSTNAYEKLIPKIIRAALQSTRKQPMPDDVASAIDRATGKIEYELKPFTSWTLCKADLDIIIRAASAPSAEVRGLVAALTKIQTISAHMESKRSGELNKIASQALAPYQKDFL